MYRVADYLIQAQAPGGTSPDARPAAGAAAQLRPLDTRGDGSAAYSLWVLTKALARVLQGRLAGDLVGVHVNIAERLSLFRKGALVALSRALGLPVVLHLHAAQLHHSYRTLPRPLQALTRWVFSLPQSCVVLGRASQQFVIDELKVPPERVSILINGVPPPQERRRRSAGGAVQRVLFVGNLSERKGVSDLLAALALPGFDTRRTRVCLVGGGDVAGYQAKAAALGLSSWVEFEGWADQQRVAQLMARADVLVLPSYDEGLPLVILEALANAVAVVCSPVGEIPGFLTDGVNALFVRPGDARGIAHSLQRVLSEPALKHQLETNGRRLYQQQFSLSQFFASVARLHQRHFGASAPARVPAELAVDAGRGAVAAAPAAKADVH
jgi:glycosyltransferase involved in cell wall biosynthesis